MTKPFIISVYNFKGGVGKTTATYNISYLLQRLGLRVLMVDADPQCSLTGMVHAPDLNDPDKAEKIIESYTEVAEGIPPAGKSKWENMGDVVYPILHEKQPESPEADAKKVIIEKVHTYENLFLLPGHISVSEMDQKVSMGVEGVGFYLSVPGYISNLLRAIGTENKIDIVLVDLNPSFGTFNGAVVMGSDYFFVPFVPDIFSLQSLRSLQIKLPEWWETIHDRDEKQTTDFGIIRTSPKYLGAYPQRVAISTRLSETKITVSVQQAHGAWLNPIYSAAERLSDILSGKASLISDKTTTKRPKRVHRLLGSSGPDKLRMTADNFVSERMIGIPDFYSAGLGAQHSGRPICDETYSHEHKKSTSEKRTFSDSQKAIKARTIIAFKKVLGLLFKNLTPEDKATLLAASPRFAEVNTYADLFVDVRVSGPEAEAESTVGIGFDGVRTRTGAGTGSSETSSSEFAKGGNKYWYENEDIDALLKHYFPNEAKILCTRGISIQHFDGDELRQALQQTLDNQAAKPQAIIPINLKNLHWTLLYLNYTNSNILPEIYYFDPLGGNGVPKAIDDITKEVFKGAGGAEAVEIHALDQRVQHDGYNCGPWIVTAAQTLTSDGALPDKDYDINVARNEHRNILLPQLESNVTPHAKRRKNEDVIIGISASRSSQALVTTQNLASSERSTGNKRDRSVLESSGFFASSTSSATISAASSVFTSSASAASQSQTQVSSGGRARHPVNYNVDAVFNELLAPIARDVARIEREEKAKQRPKPNF